MAQEIEVKFALKDRNELVHKLHDIGAKRLVDAITDTSLQSGVFYASAANTITGPVIDQAEIIPQLHDARIQDQASEAIQRFVPTRTAS